MNLAETDKKGNLYIDLGEVRVTFIPDDLEGKKSSLVFQTYLHEDHSDNDGKQFVNEIPIVLNEERTIGSVIGELSLLFRAIRLKNIKLKDKEMNVKISEAVHASADSGNKQAKWLEESQNEA